MMQAQRIACICMYTARNVKIVKIRRHSGRVDVMRLQTTLVAPGRKAGR